MTLSERTYNLEGPVKSRYMESLEFDKNLNIFRQAEKQKGALCKIAASPDGLLYIAISCNTVIGYSTFHNPDPYTRWSKHPTILEVGAVEVSPLWRKCKVGSRLLKYAFSNPLIRKRIIITMEYCWHWDLKNCGLNLWSYRSVLTKLFGSVGLKEVSTNDPEILEHEANVLMARIGEEVSPEDIEIFEKMKFMD